MAEKIGYHPDRPGKDVGNLPGYHRQMGDRCEEGSFSLTPGTGGPGKTDEGREDVLNGLRYEEA